MEPIKKFSFRIVILNILIVSTLIIFFTKCTEDPLKTGFNLLGNDTLNLNVDTLPVDLYTVSSGPYMACNFGSILLGSINDPVFGTLKTDFAADLMYNGEISFRAMESTDIINVVDFELQLPYSSLYGNLEDIDFDIYELTDTVPYDSTDYIITPNMYDPIQLNVGNTIKKLNDSTNILSVRLRNDWAQRKFFDPQLLAIDSFYYPRKYKEFKKAFKGFYISAKYPQNGKPGGIITINNAYSTTIDYAKLILRTKATVNGKVDSLPTEDYFVLGDPVVKFDEGDSITISGGKHINMYQAQLKSSIKSVVDDHIIHPEAYMQALAGPRILAKIPGLKQERDEFGYRMVINKAELVFPVNPNYIDTLLKPPSVIGIRDALNNKMILDDGLVNGYLNGTYDKLRSEYVLNVGNQIQKFLYDKTDTTFGDSFYIFAANQIYTASNSSVLMTEYSLKSPGRVAFNNSNYPDITKRPFLRIIYSKIPE
jgi:hypothetical protein